MMKKKNSPIGQVMDRVSQLPQPLLEHILYYLPSQDAARTTVLSKTWRHLWPSLAVFDFDFVEDSMHSLIRSRNSLALTEEGKQEILEKAETLMNLVGQSLVTRLNTQKALIQKLRFRMLLPVPADPNICSQIDQMIGLATRNYIRELDLDIKTLADNIDRYILPQPTFIAANSMTILRLSGCKLDPSLFVNAIKFTCLQELSLDHVSLEDEIVHKLISFSPSLQNFSLKYCIGLKDILISDHPTLEKVLVSTTRKRGFPLMDTLEIRVQNLLSLCYRGLGRLFAVEMAACKHLKELSIDNEYFTDELFQHLISNLPFLEILNLQGCSGLKRFKISSCSLKSLHFNLDTQLEEIEIDAPNLETFHHCSSAMPVLFSVNIPKVEEPTLRMKQAGRCLDTDWFKSLREYLAKFKSIATFTLDVYSKPTRFSWRNLSKLSAPPMSSIKHVKLEITNIYNPLHYRFLFDGLFWSCHPEVLSVKNCVGLTKFVCVRLMKEIQGPLTCCSSRDNKCWRHELKGVKLESIIGRRVRGNKITSVKLESSISESGYITTASQLESFFESLPSVGSVTGQQVSFELIW